MGQFGFSGNYPEPYRYNPPLSASVPGGGPTSNQSLSTLDTQLAWVSNLLQNGNSGASSFSPLPAGTGQQQQPVAINPLGLSSETGAAASNSTSTSNQGTAANKPGIGMVEVGVNEEIGGWDEHAQSTLHIVQRESNNSPVSLYELAKPSLQQKKDEAQPKTVGEYIDKQATSAFGLAATRINDIVDNGNQALRVLNLSNGYARTDVYNDVRDKIANNAEWRKEVTGSDKPLNQEQTDQAIINYVDKRLDPKANKAFTHAQQEYEKAVHHAAEKGVSVVTAVGNDQETVDSYGKKVKIKDDAGFNFLANPKEVISVAGVDKNGRPVTFSSHGNKEHQPDISALAQGVETGTNLKDGTSFAVPQVSAAVLKMLEQNPNLKPAEREDLLKKTATKTNTPAEVGGAGILNKQAAVQQAAQQPVGQIPAQSQQPGQLGQLQQQWLQDQSAIGGQQPPGSIPMQPGAGPMVPLGAAAGVQSMGVNHPPEAQKAPKGKAG